MRGDESPIGKVAFFDLCSNLFRPKIVASPSFLKPFAEYLSRRFYHDRDVKQAAKLRLTRAIEKKVVTLGDPMTYGRRYNARPCSRYLKVSIECGNNNVRILIAIETSDHLQ
jgi:hypothetical protein